MHEDDDVAATRLFGSQKKNLVAKRVLPSEKQNVERGILSYDVEVRGIVFGVVVQPDAFPAVQSIVHAPARNPCYVKRRATDNACGDNGAYYHNQDLRCRFCAIKLFFAILSSIKSTECC